MSRERPHRFVFLPELACNWVVQNGGLRNRSLPSGFDWHQSSVFSLRPGIAMFQNVLLHFGILRKEVGMEQFDEFGEK
jgi:hypothetical protein